MSLRVKQQWDIKGFGFQIVRFVVSMLGGKNGKEIEDATMVVGP